MRGQEARDTPKTELRVPPADDYARFAMQSKATSVRQYLKELPADRRAAIEAVRKIILGNIDPLIEEGMQYGMIGYYIPHTVYPPGYHCDPKQPLPFICLASQKNYMSLYLGCIYGRPEVEKQFHSDWAKTGKKLDMGKACLRFRKVEDLALDIIAKSIRDVSVPRFIEFYESVIKTMRSRKRKSSAKTVSKSKAPGKTATRKPNPR
jgi:Domain of unknown function (DU1801)